MASPFDDLVKEGLALIDYTIDKDGWGPKNHRFPIYCVKSFSDVEKVADYFATQIKDTHRFAYLKSFENIGVYLNPVCRKRPELGEELTIEYRWPGCIPAVEQCLRFKLEAKE